MDEIGEKAVREARLEDVEALAEIHVASYELAHRGLAPDEVIEVRTVELRRRVWRERLATPTAGDLILVVEADGEVAGFASFRMALPDEAEDDRTALWENLYQAPRQIGGGLALALYQGACVRLRERGCSELVAFVASGNERIADWVERQGFTFDGGWRDSNGVRELRIRRPLG